MIGPRSLREFRRIPRKGNSTISTICRRCAFSLHVAWTLLLLVTLCGCSADPAVQQPPPLSPEKQAILDFWTTVNKATTTRLAGDCEGAIPKYQAALELNASHEDSHYYLGHCLLEMDRKDEAMESFRSLLALNPDSSRGHVALGAILAASGRDHLDEAEKHFQRAHEVNGEETGPMLRLGEVYLVKGDFDKARYWLQAAADSNHRCVEAPFLLGYIAWENGDAKLARTHYDAALEAAQPEKLIKGVLGEGDTKPAENPSTPRSTSTRDGLQAQKPSAMGDTLFGAFCTDLRALDRPESLEPEPTSNLDSIYAPLRAISQLDSNS